ncbi:MAG: hypothetical protein H6557_09715 [Lewinellaceae bacterium]|nr:hypothetical protein [Lewinellaceae bacterium]
MAINFLDTNCRTESNKGQFGLCDDPPPAADPAYIDETDASKWIGIVNNHTRINIEFYAIDNCVTVLRADGSLESRCDGLLSYQENLIFVELKPRGGGQWLKKGREQLTITINRFKLEHDITVFNKVEAYVCNNLRPLAHSGQASNIQKFRDDTGLILRGQQTINL